jgi:hypothetical protein
VQKGRVEILGGLFYGGIPSLLPEVDVRGQVQMMAEYWESLLGTTPKGVWLPELAWCGEVPRLLADTGLIYGFVASSQIAIQPDPMSALVVVERGEQNLPAFVLDSELSTALANGELSGWRSRIDALAGTQGGLATVWLNAGSMIEADNSDRGALGSLLDCLSGMETVLPADSFAAAPRATPVRLKQGLAPELWPAEPRPDFADFAFRLAAVDNLTRRMLRARDKLADAISTMEDEEFEDAWSDSLATAQRLVFAAQSPDPYVHADDAEGLVLREAALARLIHAEALIDALVQGEDDWLATEENDVDADLRDEVFVCNRHVTAWVVPADGGRVRAIDDRHGELTLIDPSETPRGAPRAITEHLLEVDAAAASVFSGEARDLMEPPTWEIIENRIDEEGDCAYHLKLSTTAVIDNGRKVELKKVVSVPIDAAEVQLDYDVRLTGGAPVLLATEIPIRLPAMPTAFLANGDPLDPGALELSEVETLRLETEAGAFEVNFAPAAEVWCKVAGQRVLMVLTLKVEDRAQSNIRITWTSKSQQAEQSANAGVETEYAESAEPEEAVDDAGSAEGEGGTAGDAEEDGGPPQADAGEPGEPTDETAAEGEQEQAQEQEQEEGQEEELEEDLEAEGESAEDEDRAEDGEADERDEAGDDQAGETGEAGEEETSREDTTGENDDDPDRTEQNGTISEATDEEEKKR